MSAPVLPFTVAFSEWHPVLKRWVWFGCRAHGSAPGQFATFEEARARARELNQLIADEADRAREAEAAYDDDPLCGPYG